MSTKTFNISALSPILQYDPQQDLTNSVWKSDPGGLTNGNVNSGSPSRQLRGTGTVTISGFGSGLGFAGSFIGVYCSYTATLTPGDGNTQPSSSIPPVQTAPPTTGMLASFTGLPIDNWDLQLKGNCDSGSMVKVTNAVIDGWVGVEGGSVSTRTLDDTSSELNYSGVDWSDLQGLAAPFHNDTQHYTSSGKATMNVTFSGSAIVVWSSVDGQHGPYAASIYPSSTPVFSDDNTVSSSGYNPFLAVPIPYFFASGLDPTQTYTLCLQNKATNGTYLDLDYIEIYTSTGGGPPNGGTAALPAPSNNNESKNNLAPIIGGAVGGGVVLLLLLLLAWWFWRRRKIKIDRSGGVRPLPMSSAGLSPVHTVPMQIPNNVLSVPYSSTQASQSQARLQEQYMAERQGLLYPNSQGSPQTMTNSFSMGSSSAYDPYAAYGGGYPSPHSSTYMAGAGVGPGYPTDPVQARRQGKAAEIDAARERMRIANNGSAMSPSTMSSTTPYPHQPASLTQTMTGSQSQVQSWDATSRDPSTPAPSSVQFAGINVNPTDVKTPEEPPPSYEHA